MTKAEQARALYRAKPWLTMNDIAGQVGCTTQNVCYAVGPQRVDGRSTKPAVNGKRYIPLPELGL